MDTTFYGFVVVLFAAVILMIEGAYLWWSSTRGGAARRIERRLRMMSSGAAMGGERVSILKHRRYSEAPGLDRLLRRLGAVEALDRLLLQAGVGCSVAQLLAGFAACTVAGVLLTLSLDVPGLPATVIVGASAMLPYGLLARARAARLHRIEQQLPETTDFIARALRAGHSFSNVLQMVGAELPEPISGEFRTAHEEINYGVQMDEALHNLAARIPLTDLRYLVIAVLIQRESGGNLAEILGNISAIIRQRLKLIAQVRVLSAEGRMSAWILTILPFGVLGMMWLANPAYVSVMWTNPAGVTLMWYGAGMIVFGVAWMRRVIRIRV